MSIATPIRHLFDGVAYPAAKVVPDLRQEIFHFDNPVWTPNAPTAVRIETTGRGRRWSATEPMAFWMMFCEIDINDDKTIVDWIARYGDPASALKPGTRVHTAHWHGLRSTLRPLYRAWAKSRRRLTISPASIPNVMLQAVTSSIGCRAGSCRC